MLLQLETETKARLTPTLSQLGIDITEQVAFRQMGLAIARKVKGVNWQGTMLTIREILKPAVNRYRDIAASAPLEYLALTESMVIHEESLYDFVELELAGKGHRSIDVIYNQIINKTPPR